ncbi:hypothetical protein CAPTEDRAFT_213215 [Capitella teleta]|uniref:Uncharacterized protein n=1 Tax=Capitella teleta TaxID=283909 RepID=R7VIJ6_CAPTE|nr:hypothetical protein CAPTEDRAFT_213215 [Capitella teleta]|eukprot:ELU18367.1 hypothetical protein CAPTEDRAFT_213215 [Capitella teleta]
MMSVINLCNYLVSVASLTLLAVVLFAGSASAQCGASCGACARRYGCMTPAWGKCCTQFFMHNGKRSDPAFDAKQKIDNFIEYIRLKSNIINPNRGILSGLKASDDFSDQGSLEDFDVEAASHVDPYDLQHLLRLESES